MNNSQRNFLIEKIEKTIKVKLQALRDSIEKKPDLSNHLLHALMSGNLGIISVEEIKNLLNQRSLKSTSDRCWLGGNNWQAGKGTVTFKLDEFFEIPKDYKILYDKWKEKKSKTEEEIYSVTAQLDGLVTRIKLASNKTLESMIKEVDDMGDITLMETKIKLLT